MIYLLINGLLNNLIWLMIYFRVWGSSCSHVAPWRRVTGTTPTRTCWTPRWAPRATDWLVTSATWEVVYKSRWELLHQKWTEMICRCPRQAKDGNCMIGCGIVSWIVTILAIDQVVSACNHHPTFDCWILFSACASVVGWSKNKLVAESWGIPKSTQK